MVDWLAKLFGGPETNRALRGLVLQLTERIEQLEHDQKNRDLEMEEWHGKMRRVLARINRAHAREEEREEAIDTLHAMPRANPMSLEQARLMIPGGRRP